MSALCSDPLKIGCKKPVGNVPISLPKTPFNKRGGEPCQSCRNRRAREERKAKGLPEWRAGHGGMRRL